MSRPRLFATPPSPESACFRAVDRVLRDAPALQAVGVNFFSFEGDADRDSREPTLDEAPWVRLAVVPLPSHWQSENQHAAPLSVKVECFVAGTRLDDGLDLWAAIRGALFPGDGSVLGRLAGAGAWGYELAQPAFGLMRNEEGGPVVGVKALGALVVGLKVDTPA
ncbi:MAG TPA: hypothetical protein VG406_23460 [Isosphaeraceae bacterium]|jgi:hypothetical protein|nr:hypothetical protein [Isosphaeraceae bacterium]